MGRAKQLQEVKMMMFTNVYEAFAADALDCQGAAKLLGVSLSTFYRMRQRYDEDGDEGLVDKRIGAMSARQAPVDEVMKVVNLYETKYFDFTVKHFHEKLPSYGIDRSYTWTKNILQLRGAVKKAKKRGAHRRKRPRRPLPGMLLHQDASTHDWTPGKLWDLVVTMDDASSEIYSLFFVEEEGTKSSFAALGEVIAKHGLFGSLYTDRGSHYWITPKGSKKVDKNNLTQVGRALAQLGIDHIASYSPEARGRSERMFETLQKRIPQELRVHGITDLDEANRFLRDYLPELNRRFSVEAEEEGTAFVPWTGNNLRDILCIQEERTVEKDNTVRYRGMALQIPEDKHRLDYVKTRVRVHEYVEGDLAIFHGPRKLAEYDSYGDLKKQTAKRTSRPGRVSAGLQPRPFVGDRSQSGRHAPRPHG
jgi:transposase